MARNNVDELTRTFVHSTVHWPPAITIPVLLRRFLPNLLQPRKKLRTELLASVSDPRVIKPLLRSASNPIYLPHRLWLNP